jgi:hypothetical protein
MKRIVVSKHYADLAQFVDLANCLTPDRQWPTAAEMEALQGTIEAAGQAAQGKSPAEFVRIANLEAAQRKAQSETLEPFWRVACARFGKDIPEPLRLQGADKIDIVVIRGEQKGQYCTFLYPLPLYTAAWWVREALRKLASPTPKDRDMSLFSAGQPIDFQLPVETVRITIKPDGTMRTGQDLFRDFFLPALDGRDIHRIGICPVDLSGCGRLFLALRDDRVTCSRDCANRVRVKKFRDEHPEYYGADQRQQRRGRARRAARQAARRKDQKAR